MRHPTVPAGIAAHQRRNARCRRCLEAGFAIDPRPVFAGRAGQRAYLLGLAPGRVEAETGLPWQGRAGRTLRRWLRLDEEKFFASFYCASVTRCYPGRAPSGGGDRTPSAREQELCSFWREWEFELVRPRLIVPVGGIAINRLLGITSLDACVGQRFEYGDAVAVPLPHSSGVSRWLNLPENQRRLERAIELIHSELRALEAPPK